ncbi:DUF885 domain-containing protein [Sphingomonas nostoxanthinifaciens]|uniref:DUF885 domain-containing protein n=1 Tax=Sphingomonas nostoxanthinifaciens TaxID=2872652 RepID=UPI001CC1DA1F|nr:DUF885 family protein [Sphingomonas nostoxanthinifaciens]UAK25052.1 DUF885 family protein [Sphingomonas nostoxanthinifaciens]
MFTTRREMLAGAGAIGLAGALPAQAPAVPGDTTATALLAQTADWLLTTYPEVALGLGIDKGAHAALRSRLSDRTAAADHARAASAATQLAKLKAADRGALSPSVALDLDVATTAFQLAVDGWSAMPVGEVAVLNADHNFANSPFVVSQNSGAYVTIPSTLEERHAVATAEDADAYLARIEAFAGQIDGDTGRVAADAAKGAILPDFLNDITTKQMGAMAAGPVAHWGMIESFAAKCAKAGLPASHAARAEKLAAERAVPALRRQIAALRATRAKATDAPGVWACKDGDAYYAWLVKAATTTNYSPDELHKLGVEQHRALDSQIDTLLKAQGLSQGTVGERLTALSTRPDLLFSNDDAGRAKLLAYLNGVIADVRTRLPRAFATLVKGNLVIKRVPPAIQDGMPNGYAGPGSMDGSIPGTYYINLKDTHIWPRYSLPTLCYHEGIPGHVWQGEYSFKLPLIRSLLAFNAYSEGWALYSEQLGDELGVYADDPLGRIGYLQSINFRAMRLVVDTGVHAKRWGFDQALDTFAAGTGQPREQLRAELNRYCSWPGQACGYKMGHNEINRVRDHAKAKLGKRFDLRRFDDAIVLGGNMPLTLLSEVVDRYVAGA